MGNAIEAALSSSTVSSLLAPLLPGGDSNGGRSKRKAEQKDTSPPPPKLTYGVCVVMKPTNSFMYDLVHNVLENRVIVHFVTNVPSTTPRTVHWYRDTRKLRSLLKPQHDLVVLFDGCAWDREFMLSDDFMLLLRKAKLWNILVIVTLNDSLQMAPESRDQVNMRFRPDPESPSGWEFQRA